MRATGLNTFGYRKQMKEWLDLSTQKQIPIALLIMSRAFVLKTTELNTKVYTAEESLKTSLTAFDDEVINEIIVQSADSSEDKNPEIKKRKLESIMHQNEVFLYFFYSLFLMMNSSFEKKLKKNLKRSQRKRNLKQSSRRSKQQHYYLRIFSQLQVKILLAQD